MQHDPWAETDDGPQTYDDEAYPEDHGSILYGDEGPEDDYDDDMDDRSPRRGQAVLVMALAALSFIFSLVVLASFNVDGDGFGSLFDFWSLQTWALVFLGILIALLAWLLILLLTTPQRSDADWYDEDDHPVAEYADEPGADDTITLRCPRCMNIFSLQDPWTRPFYHVCPHCEARGVYTGKEDPPEVRAQLERHGQREGGGQSSHI